MTATTATKVRPGATVALYLTLTALAAGLAILAHVALGASVPAAGTSIHLAYRRR
jgi:hypothetical protein